MGRNLEIQKVVDFILQGHSPQEKAEQILRIVGDKDIGKRSIVEAAIQYLTFRNTIKIRVKKIEIKAPLITNKDDLISVFNMMAENLNYSRL